MAVLTQKGPLTDASLDQLFREARTFNAWKEEKVSDELLAQLYDLTIFGPTAANALPARFVFLTTDEAKARLLPHLAPMNTEKSRTAPVVVLVAYDTEFYENLPQLMPHADYRSYFAGNTELIEETGFRNSSLQGAYLILAARALGLDAGPMSGFNPTGVNAEFFPDGKVKVNFIVNLGHGDETTLFPRNPRLAFDQAATIL